jgi:hypothetical protein
MLESVPDAPTTERRRASTLYGLLARARTFADHVTIACTMNGGGQDTSPHTIAGSVSHCW